MANAIPFRTVRTKPAPPTTQESLVQQIDELQRMSDDARSDIFGTDWFKTVRNFYQLSDLKTAAPSFRPRIDIPELQVLMLQEASDLSDSSPRVYIESNGQRQRDREKAFQQQWRQGFFSNQMLMGTMYALLNGLSWMQICLDTSAPRGQSQIKLFARDPETVWPDCGAKDVDDWQYVIWEDELYVEEIERRWPQARGIEPRARRPIFKSPETAGMSFHLPAGPLSVTGYSLSENRSGLPTSKLRVRTAFIYDGTREEIKRVAGSSAPANELVPARFRQKYPDGRMLVDVEGTVVFDDNNPWPLRKFPLVPLRSLPALYGFYPPAPMRFSKALQELAGRMLTQVFENAVRLNNGVWFIPAETGIDREDFAGIPGEVQMVNQNATKLPEMKSPQPFPPHYLEYPEYLFSKQRILQGFSPNRTGESAGGNISPNLFDASVLQSQFLTRMRAKFMAESIQRIAEIVYYSMGVFFTSERSYPMFSDASGDGDEIPMATWKPIDEEQLSEHSILLDPGSVRPYSQNALQRLVMALRSQGMIDVKHGLEALEVPDSGEIAQGIEQEQQLAALARIQKTRRGL